MHIQNNSITAITQKVWSLVDALPHRSAIVESDARAWVEEVVGLQGEAAIWHAIRLSGIGGSEIGVLVRNHAGIRADHGVSAHDIIAGKLMRKTPSESSGQMTRGHENEEGHALRFYKKYGAVRDELAFNALKQMQGKRPWMRYSPDDVVTMPVEIGMRNGTLFPSMAHSEFAGPRRWLIDYKAPTKVEPNNEIAFQYACQLTQGAILCHEAGIPLDGMMLSQFDWANWSLKDDVLTWDAELGQLVLDAGDHYWSYVLSGKVPDYIRTPVMTGVEDYTHQYLKTAQMYANLVALADAAKARAEQVRSNLMQPIKDIRLAGQKIAFGEIDAAPVLTLSAKQMLDREAVRKAFTPEQLAACSGKSVLDAGLMEAYLRSAEVDLKPFRVPDLDATKVYAMAVSIGLDSEALVSEQPTLSAAKHIKQQMVDFIDVNYPLGAAIMPTNNDVEREDNGELPVPSG